MPAIHHNPQAGPRLSRKADQTLAEQLAQRIAQRIEQRLLGEGARLPSVRESASVHQVSPSTVVAAYDRLLARGLVQAVPQRGYFVRSQLAHAATAPAQALKPRALPTSATQLIRGMFQSGGQRAMPALGTLPAEWLDLPALQHAARRVQARDDTARAALSYGVPEGEPRLREALAAQLGAFGVEARSEQIITTLGATQALDIITRTLLRPGEPVLVDEPGWAVEYARLAAAGMRLLPVPRGEDGPDLGVMQQLLQTHRPRLYVTVSVLHNPTGASLSLQAAHRVLQLAQAHELTIVEDDTYAWLAPPHLPRLSALDGLQRTLYVGGFSKILAPGWRVGFMAVPRHLVDALVDTKLLSSLTTPSPTELALSLCLEQGLLHRHAERVVQRLAAARSRTVRVAQAHGVPFAAPPRGLFGWVDVGQDSERLARNMLEDGWFLAPGALFHASPQASTRMRINFASSQDTGFWRALHTQMRGSINL